MLVAANLDKALEEQAAQHAAMRSDILAGVSRARGSGRRKKETRSVSLFFFAVQIS